MELLVGDFPTGYEHADLTECPIYTDNSHFLQLFVRNFSSISPGSTLVLPENLATGLVRLQSLVAALVRRSRGY